LTYLKGNKCITFEPDADISAYVDCELIMEDKTIMFQPPTILNFNEVFHAWSICCSTYIFWAPCSVDVRL